MDDFRIVRTYGNRMKSHNAQNLDKQAKLSELDNGHAVKFNGSLKPKNALQEFRLMMQQCQLRATSNRFNPRKQIDNPHQLKQVYLNLGQKDAAGYPYCCKTCSMTYFRQNMEEEKVHKKYHEMIVKGISYTVQGNDRVFATDENGNNVVLFNTTKMSANRRRRFGDLLWLIERDLGAVPITDFHKLKIYVFISNSLKICGCLILESIEQAFRVANSIHNNNSNNVEIDESIPVLAYCGVVRIWVSQSCRRQGIACKLLDVARENFIFGMTISRDEIAFSQPTTSGHHLALSYCNRNDYLVYKSNY